MINNRQNGRRRGRGGGQGAPRPNGSNDGPDRGNRIDNRARGNAAQLLEKYRNMARDAQLAGDRVNAEYYLQFADHYFRVLADNRARQDEQQQRIRPSNEGFDDESEGFDGGDDGSDDFRNDRFDRQERPERQERPDRNDRPDRGEQQPRAERQDRNDRPDRYEGDRNRQNPRRNDRVRSERPVEQPSVEAQARPEAVAPAANMAPIDNQQEEPARPRRGRPRRPAVADSGEPAQGLDAAVLPPYVARADKDGYTDDAAPRKRTRRVRPAEAAE